MKINITNTNKVDLHKGSINLFVQRYKDYLLPIFVVFACILILFFVIIPQFQNYLLSRRQLDEETQKLNVLKNNYNFLTSLDDSKNSSDLKLLSLVLPPSKDFTGIINAISASASKTGVSIGDFSFSLGNLAKAENLGISSQPSIKIEINLIGDAQAITNFINELYKTAPVAEIVSVKTNLNNSNLTILFYYKPFPPQNVSDDVPVVQISSKNLNLLKQIYAWNNTSNQDIFGLPIISSNSSNLASLSGGLNPSPF
jgi:hypothetical protein